MNQRLEDLMYQAGLTAQGSWDSMDPYDQQAIERFAELIVRECAQFVFVLDAEPVSHKIAARMLQEHFGVES